MTWPPFFAQSLALGSPDSGVGVCLLWTPQDRVLLALDPADYALVGNLYSRDGVSFILRTLLARPTIRTILLCGRDMTGSGATLLALMRDGLDSEGRIVGDGTRLHAEIPREAVDLVRRSVMVYDARDTIRPEHIASLLAQFRRPAEPFAAEPLCFLYREPVAAALPAADCGLVLRAPTVRSAYLKLLWHVLRFGVRGGTQHSSDQRELLDVLTVVSDEPADLAACSYADWMPFTRESLGERLPGGGFSGYLGQFLEDGQREGISYTYGSRLRNFAGQIDQVAAMVADLRESGASRRAVAALWNPAQDSGSTNPPCLNLVQARLRASPGDAVPKLFLTAYFRSHDIFRAWASNAYGLRALQGLIAEALGNVPLGDLAVLSHSAHMYAHDWEQAGELLAHHYRSADPRLLRDARGSFVIGLEVPDIVVRHYTPDGEHVQTFRGVRAREVGLQLMPYVGEISHALYLGQELQKAELAMTLNRPTSYRQDRPVEAEP